MEQRGSGDGKRLTVDQLVIAGSSAPPAARPRRAAGWLVAAGVALAALAAGAWLLWWQLPRWAPDWVEEHSPWLEPILRVAAARVKVDISVTIGDPRDRILRRRLATWPGSRDADLTAALDHRNPRVRWIAAYWLKERAFAPAVPALLRCLGDADDDVVEAAGEALEGTHDSASTPLALAVLEHAGAAARDPLLRWLGDQGDLRALAPLLADLETHDPEASGERGVGVSVAVMTLAQRLGRTGVGHRAAEQTLPMLSSPRAARRRRGLLVLAELGDPSCGPDLVTALVDVDAGVRAAAAFALRALDDFQPGTLAQRRPELLRLLAPRAGGASRSNLVALLAGTADEGVERALAAALDHHDWDEATRSAAIASLAKATAPAALATLAGVATGSVRADGLDQRVAAIEQLAGIHGPLAEQALIAACGDPLDDVRDAAIRALADAAGEQVEPTLVAHLGDAEEAVRVAAVETLAARRRPAGLAALVALIETARRDGAAAVEARVAVPLWMRAFDELEPADVPLDDGQRAALAAMATRRHPAAAGAGTGEATPPAVAP